MTGCAEPAEPTTQAAEQALEEERPACQIEDEPPVASLALPELGGEADLELGSQGMLRIAVTNASMETASASIRVRSRSGLGWNLVAIDAGRVPGGGTTEIEITAAALGLPRGSFDYSGSITLVAELDLDDGQQAQSGAVHVFFHPNESGWLLYDARGRASRHAEGALTERARDQRTAIAVEPGASVAYVGASPGRKISDSARYVPENDVPVDGEAE